jgi:beta-carotene/zeaxanthin 4-ketolase
VQHDIKPKPLTGLLVALLIVVLWISSLGFLSIDIAQRTPLWILPAIVGRMFIQTGLFIVAHDAIHGAVLPSNRRLNHWIGRLAVTLYAFLSYQKLSLNHWQHHQHPGQASDPDFHDGIHSNICAWYLKFMKGYLDARQGLVLFLGMGITVLTLYTGFHVPVANLFLFWVLPIALSSMQLFFFGTYLPHRSGNTEDPHHATSSNYSLLWSFLTCYHFGYHWEHHEYPSLPWYRLPSVRKPKPQRQLIKIVIGKPLTFRLATTSLLLTLLLLITC